MDDLFSQTVDLIGLIRRLETKHPDKVKELGLFIPEKNTSLEDLHRRINLLSGENTSLGAPYWSAQAVSGEVAVSRNVKRPEEQSPLQRVIKWQEEVGRTAPAFRTALPSDKTVSMEVKVLEPVRKASKELAAAHGMTAQQFVEHLLVDALNKSPKELEQGKKRLKEFKGSTAKARRFAEREELARLRQLPSFPNR